ncbi:MAG: lmo0937 family membrane protein [Terriglobia bacterium]
MSRGVAPRFFHAILAGGLIHALLVIAAVVFAFNLLGDRPLWAS